MGKNYFSSDARFESYADGKIVKVNFNKVEVDFNKNLLGQGLLEQNLPLPCMIRLDTYNTIEALSGLILAYLDNDDTIIVDIDDQKLRTTKKISPWLKEFTEDIEMGHILQYDIDHDYWDALDLDSKAETVCFARFFGVKDNEVQYRLYNLNFGVLSIKNT